MDSTLRMRRGFKVRDGGLAAKKPKEKYFDFQLLVIVLVLMGFGFIMVFSASSYEAGKMYGDVAYFLKRQLLASLVGLGFLVAAVVVPLEWVKKAALPLVIASLVSIFMVLSSLGVEKNGARRWVKLVGGFNFQPAELAKLAVIIFTAVLLTSIGRSVQNLNGIVACYVVPGILSIIVLFITNNLSSAVIILGIASVMLFVASRDYKKFLIIGIVGFLIILAYVMIVKYTMNSGAAAEAASKVGFRQARVQAWLDPEAHAGVKGYQTLQSLYAIGSGGMFGKGIGQSMQKLGFIPEAQNDMIFSILCEETGLVGAVGIILLFMLLLWRCLVIANNAPDLFSGLMVVGVMAHMAIQVGLNIAVATNSVPNTGVSLPFISAGGSSVVFLLIEIGLVLNVSRSISFPEV